MHTTIFVGTPANHDFTNMSGNVGTPTYKKKFVLLCRTHAVILEPQKRWIETSFYKFLTINVVVPTSYVFKTITIL
ncbi:hypothetical protein LEP1GSC024_2311 [Leptospira noguchii str. 2001034031]|uniref:Uncharacterized protein n=1 Tax=Leptospira noguchii str. 2001034031 TaxID=1193053 RepID=M6XYN1_9LEPT|nr:hypothetical protein LEP1GSC024_2311 [Leptospira noguchii str. 2001034031]